MRNAAISFSGIRTLLFSLFLSLSSYSQVSIISAGISSYNITPRSLCDVSIMNSHQEVQVFLEARILNSANEVLLSVKTSPFSLKNGLNSTAGVNLMLALTEYGSSNQANYVRTSRILPSGKFNYCCTVSVLGFEETDEYCLELESDLTSFLMLVFPGDKDTIDTPNPDLVWNHSEPFNILASGEYYRIVVVELDPDQSPEAGVSVNIPVYMKNYLKDHNVLYPFDAKKLAPNKRYGWQVQLVTNGIIANKTEAWEFYLRPPREIKVNKYATLKKTIDGGFYTAEGNKLFFKFDEEYKVTKPASCIIYDSQRQRVKVKLNNEDKSGQSGNSYDVKSNGYNRFEIDLDKLDVSTGFYTLETKNEKGEVFLLKFYVE